MPTAQQQQWLAKLGVNPALIKPPGGSPIATSVPGAAPAAGPGAAPAAPGGPPPSLGKIPVPQVSGDSKAALVKAMLTIDSIKPSDKASGLFTIVTDGTPKQITQAQLDDIRAKTKAAFKQNIRAVTVKAEAANDLYAEQKKVDAEQKAVSTAVKLVKMVTSLGRFEDPGPALAKEVAAARAGIAAASAAIDGGAFAKAAEALADAEAAAAKAAAMAHAYNDGMIDGAGASITALECTETVCFVTVAVLATVATAGAASGAIGATTTAFGAEVGTAAAANAIATAAPIASTVATVGTKVALGQQVDWGTAAIDVALQLFLSRFGGPATKGISAAVTKRLAGKLAAESIARIGIEKMVQGMILQEGSTTLQTVAQSVYSKLRGQPITWDQFFKTLYDRLTDPKDLAVAAIVTAITTGAEMKYGGVPSAAGASEHGGKPPGKEPPPETRKPALDEPITPAKPALDEPVTPASSASPPPPSEPPKPAADASGEGDNLADWLEPTAHPPTGDPKVRRVSGLESSGPQSKFSPKAGGMPDLEPTADPPARGGRQGGVTREEQLSGIEPPAEPPQLKEKSGYSLADFDKKTAGTGGIKSIEKGPDSEGLYGIAIEGELKDPIPRKDAPNYNGSDKIIDPDGPGLKPEEWEKAHLVGPGFGDEAAAGLMNAPKEMNQFYQNKGVEGWMRDLHQAVKAVGGKVTYKAKAVAWDFPVNGWKPTSGGEFVKVVEYDVVVDIPGKPKQPIRISIETAPPPQAKVIDIKVEPEGAANPADLLSGL